jgi:hypothetical protein
MVLHRVLVPVLVPDVEMVQHAAAGSVGPWASEPCMIRHVVAGISSGSGFRSAAGVLALAKLGDHERDLLEIESAIGGVDLEGWDIQDGWPRSSGCDVPPKVIQPVSAVVDGMAICGLLPPLVSAEQDLVVGRHVDQNRIGQREKRTEVDLGDSPVERRFDHERLVVLQRLPSVVVKEPDRLQTYGSRMVRRRRPEGVRETFLDDIFFEERMAKPPCERPGQGGLSRAGRARNDDQVRPRQAPPRPSGTGRSGQPAAVAPPAGRRPCS